MRRDLGFKSVEGWNLILRNGQTKPTTLARIADILGVHKSAIIGQKMRLEVSNSYTAAIDEKELIRMRDQLNKHELEIAELKGKYTNLLEDLLRQRHPPQG